MKTKIANIDHDTREDIRDSVDLALEFWPNAHLGTYSRHHDMRQAFKMIRLYAAVHGIHFAIARLRSDACAHMDM